MQLIEQMVKDDSVSLETINAPDLAAGAMVQVSL